MPEGAPRASLRLIRQIVGEMAAGDFDEHVFETGVARGEASKIAAARGETLEQRWDGKVGFADGETHAVAISAGFGDSRQVGEAGGVGGATSAVAGVSEFDDVFTAEAGDELAGCVEGDDLAVI